MRRPTLCTGALGALLLPCWGCDDSGRGGEPPPDGVPWLAETYAVRVTLLGSTCAPGGLTAEAHTATATVLQSGTTFKWAQRSTAPDAETWFLEGAICLEGDNANLLLSGGRRDTVSGCQVATEIPPAVDVERVDACDPLGQASLSVDTCGQITGIVDAQLKYGRDCAHRSPCLLRLRLDARPTALNPQAPPLPDTCTP